MAHSYVTSYYHCVFSTKERRPLILPRWRDRLWAYMGGIARENKMRALAVGGTENHAHMLLSLPSTIDIAKAMQLIKGSSSKWSNDEFSGDGLFQWQEGYGAFSIGVSQTQTTEDYIARQEDHHRRQTFEEEFIAFLDRHGIGYDPKFVFG